MDSIFEKMPKGWHIHYSIAGLARTLSDVRSHEPNSDANVRHIRRNAKNIINFISVYAKKHIRLTS
jgi:hypothetical protein